MGLVISAKIKIGLILLWSYSIQLWGISRFNKYI